MVKREMQDHLLHLCKGFPIITITGPRQSGKTTLAKMTFPDYYYLDLENLNTRRAAKEDPSSLFANKQADYIVDEFQYAPELLSTIKSISDEVQKETQFILTGSNQFTLMKDISQSLAGRSAIMELLPFSLQEAYPKEKQSLNTCIFRGFYPRLLVHNIEPTVFYDSYIRTYLQRDIRLLSNIQNLDDFTRFLSLCAGRTGSLLNKESLANEIGVDSKTIGNWLSVLQTSYIIYLLKPWQKNISKRLIKSPKLYFYDTGLACNLLQIRNETDLANHPLRGNLFETFILSEVLKFFHNRCIQPPLSFYRESNGTEIDLLIEKGNLIYPLEIKSASVINNSFYRNILKLSKSNLPLGKARIVYGGNQTWENDICKHIGWQDLSSSLTLL
ncbi:MAG TPA: ATP-binding protein [Candidatus Cloacimonas acidaminovorans]|jgi:predicted AAA+ superfamily ATPase|nr:ATP-binding protein [Candidatus Cloacimonas acidaminovorans]HRS60503.1 ATP-binding protein [Candidatus Cloacimonas sp.]MDD5407639.1 ATP-binding protein [Candidatus Cloacimonas acidaminovorans]HOE54716.1 ATP-binding protein [Candidatus Cloacimonas acidaminovorans]HOM78838.1 ATP-binding protein [Candidatus Cloacimonas acidaminovorans]